MHRSESRFVTGWENILYAGVTVHFSAQNLFRLWQQNGFKLAVVNIKLLGKVALTTLPYFDHFAKTSEAFLHQSRKSACLKL